MIMVIPKNRKNIDSSDIKKFVRQLRKIELNGFEMDVELDGNDDIEISYTQDGKNDCMEYCDYLSGSNMSNSGYSEKDLLDDCKYITIEFKRSETILTVDETKLQEILDAEVKDESNKQLAKNIWVVKKIIVESLLTSYGLKKHRDISVECQNEGEDFELYDKTFLQTYKNKNLEFTLSLTKDELINNEVTEFELTTMLYNKTYSFKISEFENSNCLSKIEKFLNEIKEIEKQKKAKIKVINDQSKKDFDKIVKSYKFKEYKNED